MEISSLEAPLPPALVSEAVGFLHSIFGDSAGGPGPGARRIFEGEELNENRDVVYLARQGGKLVGTTHLTVSRSMPALGGLGEVATHLEFRRAGIATRLSERARDDFRSRGGEALFLGTVNPAAARLYRRLGWRKIPSTIVYAYIAGGEPPETFLVELFRERAEATVVAATPTERLSIIPLLSTPHDWQVLDANVGIYTTRYAVLRGCMSLYPRYEALWKDGRGTWFAARTGDGRLVGLSTARLDDADGCQVDGFTHGGFAGAWAPLLEAAASWAAAKGATVSWALVCVEDEVKRSLLEAAGFREAGSGKEFDIEGRAVGSLRLERTQ